jgi:hypothetical protein
MSAIYVKWVRVKVMVFNATFNNISVISWRSVLVVEETEVPGESNCILYLYNLQYSWL